MFQRGDKVKVWGQQWYFNKDMGDGTATVYPRGYGASQRVELSSITPWVPLPKKVPQATGTCQICGREIGSKRGLIAHHGYERPNGWHQQTASCMGARHLPFEQSRDVLGSWLETLRCWIQNHREALETLANSNPPISRYQRVSKQLVTIEHGHERYEAWKTTDIMEHQSKVRQLSMELEMQQARYDAWKAPEKV